MSTTNESNKVSTTSGDINLTSDDASALTVEETQDAAYHGLIDPFEEDVRDEDLVAFTVQGPRYRFSPVPDYVTWCPDLSDGAARTFSRIMSLTPEDNGSGAREAYWTIENLSIALGISKPTLHRHLDELVKLGMAERKKRWKKRGGQAPSVYRLITAPDERPSWPINGAEAHVQARERRQAAKRKDSEAKAPSRKRTAKKAAKRRR